MAQNIYILSKPNNKNNEDYIRDQIYVNGIYISENFELTEDILIKMSKNCKVEYFYVILANTELTFDYDFSFKPLPWDSKYIHIWNNTTILRLFNKNEVLKNPTLYTDKSFFEDSIEYKNINENVYSANSKYDMVFLSYNETFADKHYELIKERFPYTKRIHGINGIFEAHREAAKISSTDMFYIIDADALILDSFNFNYICGNTKTVHVWNSQNPVNDLVYGYGGVKLLPKDLILNYNNDYIDFTTSLSNHFKISPEISNITKFNVDPFSTWRSAFRECTKLSSKIINNQCDEETEERLNIWCTRGEDREFGEYAICGANDGKIYGLENKNNLDSLKLINDFNWLKERFLTKFF